MGEFLTMKLKYNDDGVFRIVQFTDTHLGNRPYNKQDKMTFSFLEKAVDYFKDYDLFMHTGDVIWSEGVKNADQIFEETINKFNRVDVPAAVTFGNHDSEEIITRTDLRNMFDHIVKHKAEKTNCMIMDDRESYTIEIYSQDETEVKNVLFVLDSGAEAPLPIGIYDWNQPEQVAWFNETAKKYKKGDGVKRNIVFQHIPIPEYWQSVENIVGGSSFETDEQISAPHINTGMFANMLLNGETWGMFVGHDHENNFDSIFHDIHLVYGNVSGYNTYGEVSRGVRIVELHEDGEISTEIIKASEFLN